MRDLDAVLGRIDAVLNLPDLPPLTPWVVSTPVDRPVETVRQLLAEDRLRADSPLLTGRWDLYDGQGRSLDSEILPPAAERPRPRPPRPFPVPESDALARRVEAVQDMTLRRPEPMEPAKPRPWWGRWRHRG